MSTYYVHSYCIIHVHTMHENEHITQNTYKLHACSHAYNTLTHTFVFAGA